MKIKKWVETHCVSLHDKNIVITGATSGLGYETLKHLCELNATIIVGVRNTQKCEEQKQEMKKIYPNCNITIFKLDLEDIQSIKNFANKIKFICDTGIDVLINNAGTFKKEKRILKNGYEQHFFINCIAPLCLTRFLTPSLSLKPNSKVVFLGSISCNFTKINIDDFDFKNCKNDMDCYANSKRWLTFSVFKLKEELKSKGIEVNLIHPGISATSLFLNSRFKKLQPVLKLIFTKPNKACLNELAGIFWNTKSGFWIGPKLFDIWGNPKNSKLKLKNYLPEEHENCYKLVSNIINNQVKM